MMSWTVKKRMKRAILAAVVAGAIIVPAAITLTCYRVWSRQVITQHCGGMWATRVYEGDRLLYFFAYPLDMTWSERPCDNSVYWDFAQRNVLQVKGKNVPLPAGARVLLIRGDGTVVPVAATEAEVDGESPFLFFKITAAMRSDPSSAPSTSP